MLALLRLFYWILSYRIDQLVLSKGRSPSFWLSFLLPKPKHFKEMSRGERLKNCLITLGPFYIKLGQILSTRHDLLPSEIITQLQQLQDDLPPIAFEHLKPSLDASLGDLNQHFATFNTHAVASASIAQVHEAVLFDGRHVVVKILKPNISDAFHKNIKSLRKIARLIHVFHPKRKQLQAMEVIKFYEKIVKQELDLTIEAANQQQMQRLFSNSHQLFIPNVIWELTSKNILVADKVDATPFNSALTIKTPDFDRKKMAHIGIELFFTQLLDHNFFHADMHPGNIFIDLSNPHHPSYITVDHGIIGSLSDHDLTSIAKNLHAFFKQDYLQVARLHIAAGWVPQNTDIYDMAASLRAIGEPIASVPLKQISFGHILSQLMTVAQSYHMQHQPQLFLLQKTLFNVEALARSLDPDLDLWQDAAPQIEAWLIKKNRNMFTLERMEQLFDRFAFTFEHGFINQEALSKSAMAPSPHRTYSISSMIYIPFLSACVASVLSVFFVSLTIK